MRENELEQRQMEAAKILAILKQQEAELQEIYQKQLEAMEEAKKNNASNSQNENK